MVTTNRVNILVINCGSSSLKWRVMAVDRQGGDTDPGSVERVAGGTVKKIGSRREKPDDHASATEETLDELAEQGWLKPGQLYGVGHRVVHGGKEMVTPTLINSRVVKAIEETEMLAPLHNGPALAAINVCRGRLSRDLMQVAVFDTAFHRGMDEHVWRYAIPIETADNFGLRRYGFHGLAHRSMTEGAARLLDRPASELKLITLQLGSGCSAAAVDGGRSLDTTMGLTPLGGLMMATRSGDIDPALMRVLMERTNQSAREVEAWLNHSSGMLGVTGTVASVSEAVEREADGDTRAQLALAMYVHRVQKAIGGCLATLGGADAIVFGGGVGENVAEIRRRICDGLAWCGLNFNARRNDSINGSGEITTEDSAVRAFVAVVDEASVISRQAMTLLDTFTEGHNDEIIQ